MNESRDQLRHTFDTVAATYHHARPDYPEALFDALVRQTGLAAGAELLEVGPATGKATLPLARRGFRITAVEPGPALVAQARRNLAAFPQVQIIEGDFEQVPVNGRFDLVYAATAWHWIDPAVRYRRAGDCLRDGGHLAFWTAAHVFPVDGDPIFDELQAVYDEINESRPTDVDVPRPGQLPDERAEVAASRLFDDIRVSQFDWEIRYDAEGYLALLDTFSGHLSMQPWQRGRLYGAIRDLLDRRSDGLLRRHWGCVLHTARRIARSPADRS